MFTIKHLCKHIDNDLSWEWQTCKVIGELRECPTSFTIVAKGRTELALLCRTNPSSNPSTICIRYSTVHVALCVVSRLAWSSITISSPRSTRKSWCRPASIELILCIDYCTGRALPKSQWRFSVTATTSLTPTTSPRVCKRACTPATKR